MYSPPLTDHDKRAKLIEMRLELLRGQMADYERAGNLAEVERLSMKLAELAYKRELLEAS